LRKSWVRTVITPYLNSVKKHGILSGVEYTRIAKRQTMKKLLARGASTEELMAATGLSRCVVCSYKRLFQAKQNFKKKPSPKYPPQQVRRIDP